MNDLMMRKNLREFKEKYKSKVSAKALKAFAYDVFTEYPKQIIDEEMEMEEERGGRFGRDDDGKTT